MRRAKAPRSGNVTPRGIDNARMVKALRRLPATIFSEIEDKLRLLAGL